MQVIKYGGNAISDNSSIDNFAQAVARLWQEDKNLVLIHGGGPQINYWLDKAGIKSEFIKGMRFTSPEVLEVVEMALCANVNKALVRAFLKLGVKAVGISGQDGELLKAEQRADLGLVGDIRAVNPSLIKDLLKQGFLPIVAPLGLSPEFSPLNINADYAAAHIAGALEAQSCIFMTNVDGVLDKNKNLIKSATKAEIDALIADGTISGGMLPKVDCCLKALELGVKQVKILNANNMDNLFNNEVGTSIE